MFATARPATKGQSMPQYATYFVLVYGDFLRQQFTPAVDTRDDSKHACGVCVCVRVRV